MVNAVHLRPSDAANFAVGCTVLEPIRTSDFAVVCFGEYRGGGDKSFGDKTFTGDVINVTLRGRWDVFGRHGFLELEEGTAMLGRSGESYGCRHTLRERNANLIVGLRPETLDEGEPPLFGLDCIRMKMLPSRILRAFSAESTDAFESLIFELVDDVSKLSRPNDRERSGSRLRMQHVKRFIERHAFERIRLSDIAATANVYPFAVIRQFRRAFGVTPYAYVTRCRMSEAMRLLGQSSRAIEEIASRAGFPDAAYFARVFRRETGLTPTAFRQRQRE